MTLPAWSPMGHTCRLPVVFPTVMAASYFFQIAYAGFSLAILHTNDVHAEFEQFNDHALPCTKRDIVNNECYGGIARRMTAVKETRKSDENVLLLDAGDAFRGTTWFDVYEGNATAYFMNYLSYDAMALGNHELDSGVEGLIPFLKAVDFPVLSCNMDTSREPSLTNLIQKSVVLTIGGEKVGIVGYITSLAPVLTNVGNLRFEEEAEAVQKEVDRLIDGGIDKIIAVGHSGYGIDLEIARKVTGIDVIVGGHSSTFLYTGKPPSTDFPIGPYPTVVTSAIDPAHQTLVVTAHMHGKYLGRLFVEFDEQGNVEHYEGNALFLDTSIKEDEEALSKISEWREAVDDYLPNVVGESYVLLGGAFNNCEDKECGLGNLVTDAMLWRVMENQGSRGWSDVGIVLMNSGGIRSSLNRGKILERDVRGIVPFNAKITKVEMSGRLLLQALEDSVRLYRTVYQSGSFFQVSGLSLEINVTQPIGSRVTSLYLRCTECLEPEYKPLNLNKMYTILVPDFISNGGDGMSVFTDNGLRIVDTGIYIKDALVDYIQKHSPITHGKERRIVMAA